MRFRPPLVYLISALAILTGCGGDADYKPVDFTKTVPIAHPDSRPVQENILRVAVAAMISPKETFIHYRELLDYLGRKSGHSIQLIQRRTYDEVNALFPKGDIDLAFICTGPFAASREKLGFQALATPQVRGQPYYQSYLIVHKDSPLQKFDDLRGRVFAFTDPDSNTGAMVPRFWLAQLGETPESFFSKTIFTYSHDNSILAVAKGLVDAAAVDGHQWEYFEHFSPAYTSKTRVIRKSQPFGSPPLVASDRLKYDVRSKTQEIMLSMHTDPEGKRILENLLIDRFVAPREEWYEPARAMIAGLPASAK
ncbi:MAG: phosphate/phosphite/phosphonate transporter, periplasmic binding protein [Proteobacteria bacterium]|jgi:phosphonate transport system substrate-binding protein|nr:phosphate/phosphite/phosphonate transporter, periplasmic binding protein [Pseudomonadota bacterium]